MTPDNIRIKCSVCSCEETTSRASTDPARAVLVVIICPDCDDGDFHSPTYWDDDGKEVMFYG